MEIKGTISRAYVGNGGNVVHVVPEDRTILKEIDGSHQTGAGEIKAYVGTLPKVGESFSAPFDDDDVADGSSPLRVT
jgi:hypothetical protein